MTAVPAVDRFWPKVEKTAGCWIWAGAVGAHGYGRFRAQHRQTVYLRGHALTPENTYGRLRTQRGRRPKPDRACLTCKRALRAARYRERGV